MNITVPQNDLGRIRIKVIGVGNAGGMIVRRVARERLPGVECGVINTAMKDLEACPEVRALQIGAKVTHGMGSGSDPDVGSRSAQEDADRIRDFLGVNDLVFLVAGFGKGTGTGATPVVADLARQAGALTVSLITKPLECEGEMRAQSAEAGLARLASRTDAFVPLSNQRLVGILPDGVGFEAAFSWMDEAVLGAVRGIVDALIRPGRINLDLADLRGLLKGAGLTSFGVGAGKGEARLADAIRGLTESPFLADPQVHEAGGLLVSITGGLDLGMKEVNEVVRQVRGMAGGNPRIAFGVTIDEALQGEMRVMLLTVGLNVPPSEEEGSELFPEHRAAPARETLYRPERLARGQIRPAQETPEGNQAVAENIDTPAYLRRRNKSGPPVGRG